MALAPSIAKAKRAGISVITLNIDATEAHAAHVEMNHYFGAMDIAKALGDGMGGKGKVAILNAPPGIIIRDQRTNGFVDGLKKYHPDIQVVADQVADWDRKKAQDVLNTILAANPDLGGVYGVNDSMALGAVDVAKEKGLIGKLVIFGNDGEVAALESIEAGELTGTQYTDVYQQGRLAAARCHGAGDRRSAGDSLRPTSSPADALRYCHQGKCGDYSALPALVDRSARVAATVAAALTSGQARCRDDPRRERSAHSFLRGNPCLLQRERAALRLGLEHREPDVGVFVHGHSGDGPVLPHSASRN